MPVAVLTLRTAVRGPIDVAIEFADERRAFGFERYLKSGSGVAFAQRHARADPRIPGWMQLTALEKAEERQDEEGQRVYSLLKRIAGRLGKS
jgi:hypothetical protein